MMLLRTLLLLVAVFAAFPATAQNTPSPDEIEKLIQTIENDASRGELLEQAGRKAPGGLEGHAARPDLGLGVIADGVTDGQLRSGENHDLTS